MSEKYRPLADYGFISDCHTAAFVSRVLDSGCCGLAGSFGFEAQHYELSVKIGEQRSLPTVRELP